jgi:hypothetical protein
MRKCAVDGCERAYWASGYCSPHYQRFRKTGNAGHANIGNGKGSRLAWLMEAVKTTTDDCVMWPFSFDPSGYGAASYMGKKIGAHRLACVLASGPAPEGCETAHKCGNKWCVNPLHVRWATRSENMMDKYDHGKMTNGEKNSMSKLTDEKVKVAKKMRASGLSYSKIANQMGVSRYAISRAVNERTWRAEKV